MNWVTLLFVTQLDFATDPSAIQAGSGMRLVMGTDVAVALVENFELAVGWRWLLPADSDDELVSTEGHRITFGPRFRAPVSQHWGFVFAVQAEATYLDLEVTLPENAGDADDWAYGATPSIAIDGVWPTDEDFGVGFRTEVGYGFRTNHDYHAVRFAAEGDNVMPLDMGDLNLSGFYCDIAVRVAFK